MKKLIAIAMLGLVCNFVHADTLTIEGPCDVHFSPKGGATTRLVNFIGSAQRTIRVLAFSFTSKPISDALIAAHKRGVDVQIILDKSQPTANGGRYADLLAAGVPVFIDSKHAIAHNKTIVVDGLWFETGSFNYTASAENSNGENSLICRSVSGAAVYAADWLKHYNHSTKAQ